MLTAYITKEAGKIKANNKTLIFEGIDGNKTTIYPDKVDRMIVMGNIGLTGAAISLILSSDTDVFFMKGKEVLGLYSASSSKDCITRHNQHLFIEDQEWVCKTSKAIVKGKIINERHFIQRLIRNGNIDSNLGNYATTFLKKLINNVDYACTVDSIRGIEGLAAECYFEILGQNFKSPWASFSKRTKNPPKDCVNTTLSFLYTILTNKISSFIKSHGLDISIGSLHSIQYGRDSLSCDLVEEFRTPIVDQLVCSMINLGQLKEDNFLYDDESVLLNEEGRKIVISAFENKLQQKHFYPNKDKVLTYEKILEEQAMMYKHYINKEIESYIPFEVK